jgi:hypothetical protein
MSLLKLWFIRNPVLVSYSICMRQGSSDLSGSQSALACLCVCARAQLGLREFNKNRDGTVVSMIALLDTGATATIILRELVGKGRACTNTNTIIKWKTLGGIFTTNYESLLDFKFPELSSSKVVTWQAHVDDKTSSKEAAYDMIIGMDLMTSIGIMVDCRQRCIRWGGTEILLNSHIRSCASQQTHMHSIVQNSRSPSCASLQTYRDHSAP